MADELKTGETTTAGDTTQQTGAETKEAAASTEAATDQATAKAGESVKTEADPEVTNNAVMAALRKRDLEAARKLLKDELEPEKPDLTNFVPKDEFEKLQAKQAELESSYEKDKHQLQVENIIQQHDLTEADVKLIQTDDLELFRERAAELSQRKSAQVRRSAVASADIPEDMKDNDMYQRLMRG